MREALDLLDWQLGFRDLTVRSPGCGTKQSIEERCTCVLMHACMRVCFRMPLGGWVLGFGDTGGVRAGRA